MHMMYDLPEHFVLSKKNIFLESDKLSLEILPNFKLSAYIKHSIDKEHIGN